MADAVVVRRLACQPYEPVWQAMQRFTDTRDAHAHDEFWLLEHFPVFTQGQAGKAEHVLMPGDIPVVQADRGGQVTYHGPGQLVVYVLIDVRRRGVGVRELVSILEDSLTELLSRHGIEAYAKPDAPGVYVDEAKIASLGLRIRRGCSFHGLALNVDMDLMPFQRINPCGYQGMKMTQMRDLVQSSPSVESVGRELVEILSKKLNYSELIFQDGGVEEA